MKLTSPSRRVLGLLAAGTVGLSTAVLGTGVAQAVGGNPTGFDPDSGVQAEWTVPEGTCVIEWVLTGARGGADDQGNAAAAPDERTVRTMVTPGDVFTLVPGAGGADAPGGAAGPGGAGGTNGAGGGSYDGAAGVAETDGGGGAASTVMEGDDYVHVWVDGSAGAGAGGGAGGTNPGGNETSNFDYEATESRVATASAGPDGSITGTGFACDPVVEEPVLAAPLAPLEVTAWPGNRTIRVNFTENYADGVAGADTWEYRVGGGAWTPVEVNYPDQGGLEFTLTGLTNGVSHTIRVRGVSEAAGPGAESAPVTATPYKPIGAPASVTATAGPAEVTIDWTPPTTGGSFPVAGYEAVLMASYENRGGEIYSCEADADVRSCTVPAMPGDYGYVGVVYAIDSQGNRGEGNGDEVGVVPAPAEVPAADGTLEAPPATTGGVVAGEQVTFSGSGYAPFGPVTLLVYSEPTVIGTVTTDENGAFTATVTLPAGLAAGSHTLVAAGLDPSGEMRYLTLPITVITAADQLAFTGFDVQAPLTGGLAALGIGAALIVVSRRRRVDA